MFGRGSDRAGLYYERDILGLDWVTFRPRMGPIPKFCFKNAWDAVIFGCKCLGFNGLHGRIIHLINLFTARVGQVLSHQQDQIDTRTQGIRTCILITG